MSIKAKASSIEQHTSLWPLTVHVYRLSKSRPRIFKHLIIYVPADIVTYDSLKQSGDTELNIDLDTYFVPNFEAINAFVYFVYILLMQDANVRRELKKYRGPRRLVKGVYLLNSPPAYLPFVGSIICLYLPLGTLLSASIMLSLYPIKVWSKLYSQSWWIPVTIKVWNIQFFCQLRINTQIVAYGW